MKKWILFFSLGLVFSVFGLGQQPELVVQMGHISQIRFLDFSPDGQYVLTGGKDVAKLWDLKGREIQTFRDSSRLSSAAFTPDGQYVVIGREDKSVRFWYPNGQEAKYFTGPSNYSVEAFSPDGEYLLTGQPDGTVQLWDLDGQVLKTLRGHSSSLLSVAFSKDGEYMMTGSNDGMVIIWNRNGRRIRRLIVHQEKISDSGVRGKLGREFRRKAKASLGINALAFSADGQLVLTGNGDTVKLWNQDGRVVRRFVGHSSTVNSVAFSPNGQYALSGSWDGTVILWNLEGGERQRFNCHTKRLDFVIFSPDGQYILTTGGIGTNATKLWNLQGRQIQSFVGHASDINSVAFAPDGRHVLAGSQNMTATCWSLDGIEVQSFVGHSGWITSVAFSPDGQYVLTGSSDTTARLWNRAGQEIQRFESSVKETDSRRILSQERIIQRIKGHLEGINAVAFSGNGEFVLTGSNDWSAIVWEMDGDEFSRLYGERQEEWRLTGAQRRIGNLYDRNDPPTYGHYLSVTSIASSPYGDYVLTGSKDNFAIVWDLTGYQMQRYKGHLSWITSLAFSPSCPEGVACPRGDGRYVLTGSQDGTAKLWELTGKEVRTFQHTSSVNAVAFSPDFKYILTGSGNEVILWTFTGEKAKTFTGHTSLVTSVAFSPNGKYLFTGSLDGTTKLWEVKTGKLLLTLYSFTPAASGTASWLKVNPDNYYMGSRNMSDYIHFKIGMQTYSFDQFDLRLNRPDKVLENLIPFGVDSSRMLQYRQAYYKRLEKYGFTEDMLSDGYHVPECAITNADQLPITTREGTAQLDIEALDTLRLLDRLNVYVNGVPLYGPQGVNLREENTRSYTTTLDIPLSRGQNKIQVSALNQGGAESLKAATYITYDAPEAQPNLYLITIGVSDYQAEGKDLQYAAKDALDIAGLYRSAEGFNVVHIKTLINNQVTKTNIRTLRSWLEQSRVDDQVLLYVSGHGLIDDNYDFYYATHDIDFADPAEKGILYDEIEGLLDGIPARKKLLLMDACHSGEFDEEAPPLTAEQQKSLAQKGVSFKGFSKGDDESGPTLGLQNSFELMQQLFADLRRGSGATVITSSTGVQVSYEDADWQNGVFTYAFLYGLKSMQADSNGDGQVTASEIQAFVAEYVPRLTEDLQVPTFRRENLEFDFRVW